jgi:hypothetical protein
MVLSRRRMLKHGLAGGTILLAGSIWLHRRPTEMVEAPEPLEALEAREYSILYAIAERLLPRSGAFPAASELGVALAVDKVLAKADPGLKEEIRLLLAGMESGLTGMLFEINPNSFTRSSPETQDAVLTSWKNSGIPLRRTAFKAMNLLCGAAYYASPKSFAAVGYGGPPKHLLAQIEALQGNP